MAVIKIKVDGRWTELPALVTQSGAAVLAPDYDDLTFPVKKGTACLHEGLFYIAKQNISMEEDWTSAHWRLTTIGEEIRESEEKVYFVNGSHASLTSAWTGDLSEVETLQNGIMILYRLPIGVGSGSVSLTLTLKNESSGAVPVYYNDGTRVTGLNAQKGLKAGSVLLLTYYNSTWKCTSVDWDKYNTHLGMVVTSGGYNLDVNGFVLNAATDDNFIPAVSGYTMLRVHNETGSEIDTFDDGDLMIGIGDQKIRLYVDGAYQFTDLAPIAIPNGSYLCFYDANGVSSGVGAFYINTDGSIPGQVVDSSLSITGAAADAKKTGDEIAELNNEISELDQTKLDSPVTPGTSGQVLTSDGEGGQSWEDNPSASDITDAVNDWLDDHPEATTTVQDGAITMPKLNSSLRENIVIETETEKAYGHSSVNCAMSAKFYGNEYAFSNCKFSNRKNYMVKQTGSRTLYNADVSWDNGFFIIDGTSTSTGDGGAYNGECSIPAGNYRVYANVKPNSTSLSSAKAWYLYFVYDDNTTKTVTISIKTEDTYVDFTLDYHVKKMSISPGVRGITYDNYMVWIGVIPSDATITDTGISVENGSSVEYALNGESGNIDTLQHESTIKDVVKTKEYIDNHIPDDMLTESDLVYITPEMYGAKGDGTTDDTQAILDCIQASRISEYISRPIRGYGHYKITGSIEFSGYNNNVFLHEITYTGADAAVVLHGAFSLYRFTQITANSQSTAIGMRISCLQTAGIQYGFNQCEVHCNRLLTSSHTVEFTNSTSNVMYYNRLYFLSQTSINGDIFHDSGTHQLGEIDIYGKRVVAGNGYFYNGERLIRFHNFAIENQIKYGITGNAILKECRADEFNGTYNKDGDEKCGVLFYIKDKPLPGNIFTDDETITLVVSLDNENAMTFDECIDYLEENLTLSMSSDEKFILLHNYICPSFPTFKRVIAYKPNMLNTKPAMSMTAYFNHKAVIPNKEWYYVVSSATFNVGFNSSEYIMPTFFDIDVSQSEIYLDYSYCCIGIKKFKVRQYADKKAIVYDKFGNILFDGSTLSAGTYEFECNFKKHDPITLNLSGGDTYNVPSIYINEIYDGTNEVWHIYKKDEVN